MQLKSAAFSVKHVLLLRFIYLSKEQIMLSESSDLRLYLPFLNNNCNTFINHSLIPKQKEIYMGNPAGSRFKQMVSRIQGW